MSNQAINAINANISTFFASQSQKNTFTAIDNNATLEVMSDVPCVAVRDEEWIFSDGSSIARNGDEYTVKFSAEA